LELGQKQALTMVMLLVKSYCAGKIGVRRKRGGFDAVLQGRFFSFFRQGPGKPIALDPAA
jgi:hypothetical protein